MTYIDEMMKELCPDGVELKTLGELCKIETGKLNANAAIDGGEFPFFTTAKEISWINTYRWDEEALLIAGNANVGDVKYYSGKFEAYQRTYVLTEFSESVQAKYLYHYIRYDLKRYLELNTKKAAMSYIVLSTLKEFKIPLPPLEIQQEIVKILDKFTDYVTELTAELTAELTLRQQQYSFYRDKLLSFDEDSSGGANNKVYTVQWKTLGEVAENLDSQRKPVTKGNRSSGNYPYYGASGIVDYVDDYIFDGDYLLVSEDGANLIARKTPIAFSISGKSWVNNHAHILRFDDAIDQKYVGYYLNYIDLTPYISGAAQPKLNQQNLNSIKIPYPNQAIRNKIVQMLDNFDTVCNDLNIGLPKEIELRQKQYEFFRDKLLTFTAEGVYTDSTVQYRQDLIRLLIWVFGSIRVQLGAVATVVRGKRVVKSQLHPSEGYPVYQNSLTTLGYFEHYNREAETAFLISAGAAGEVGYTRSRCWTADDVWTFDTEVIDQRYLYYLLMSKQETVKAQVRKASVPRLSKSAIENLVFTLPPLDQQNRIVAILDRFDTLTTDLVQGLPAEIEQRQKQYEYWRDLLLNFP
ncbi:restriction endonuclease subunit S [Streptococcus ruminantium]|uniref:restriction endonuclease subunit S n=1 Tax=Streptococcus ruminantium TaxID=1917441 RepID=UPI0012DD4C66|nr:restriction endonuclease subunit S [Streptococcus ruminantium]